MAIACKYIQGRVVNIDCFQSDTYQNIDTCNKYHIILVEKGSLTLRINQQTVAFAAPCVITLKENLEVDFMDSHLLSAKTIQFDVTFLNINISYDLINSGQYERVISAIQYDNLSANRYAMVLPCQTAFKYHA